MNALARLGPSSERCRAGGGVGQDLGEGEVVIHDSVVQRYVTFPPASRLDGVVDHAPQKPGAEWPLHVILPNSLVDPKKCRLDEVFGQRPTPVTRNAARTART